MKQLTGLKGFSVLWAGQILSAVGTRMTNFVLGIWVWQETGQASALALLTFCAFGATVLCSPLAGYLIDRLSRRVTIMLSDLGSALATGIMVLLFLTGDVQLWQLVLTNTLTGGFLAFMFPAYAATVAELMPKEHYPKANGMLSLVRSVPGIAAPALAGVLLGVVSLSTLLLVDVCSYLIAIGTVFLVRLKKRAPTGERAESRWRDWTAGYRYIAHRRGLVGLLALTVVIGFTSAMGFIVLIPMILARTGDNEAQLGLVQSIGAVGGVLGALALTRLRSPSRKMPAVFAAVLVFSLLGQVGIGLGNTVALWAVAWFFAWLAVPFVEGYSQSIWQQKVPHAVQGRVFAATQLFENLALPIGFALSGPLVDHVFAPRMAPGGGLAEVFGPLVGTGQGGAMGLVFLLAGTIGAITAVVAACTPSVRNLEARLPDHDEPPVAASATGRSGED
ncbi:MFS transporter [Amycolatopsis sp. 195334CR]|uniref:MFS transporter n=1 Tax=Amycolatopsis sp. 195334CR TaxID=2814588 RepID=UPI001A8D7A53|nr:MFS transporter [Amycolatopsis sp. 195334CR]MBN6038825.1 MFS transporter [Amycolatopsis sp. 195334CR]